MSRHTRVDHKQVAAALRERPGTWQPVGEYRNVLTADGVRKMIGAATVQTSGHWYSPAGAYEARTRLTDDGTLVEARYIGKPKIRRTISREDPRRVHATPDIERVLGQIERGEIRCGAEAAREIAARHEAAYGEVWAAGPDPDAAWADAIASLPAQGGAA